MLPQRVDQRSRGLDFANRHGVYPDAGGLELRPESKALAEVTPMAAILESTEQHHQRDHRRGEIDQKDVEETHGRECRFQRLPGARIRSRAG